MSKYFQLIKITFQEYFVYRTNFILWQVRNFIATLTVFLFWLAVYADKSELLGYQKAQMLTYAVGLVFIRSLVMSTKTADLPGLIKSGDLTKIIIQPWRIFSYFFVRDIPDKILNIIFAFFQFWLILLIFKFPFYFPNHWQTYFLFGLSTFSAMTLFFVISWFLSVFAFWTEELWATRWLFGVIFLEFFAGAFFPIDVLPIMLQKIINLTPFPYLAFFPLKIWLEQLPMDVIWKNFGLSVLWLIFFWVLVKKLWLKGVKNYGAYG